MLRFLETKTIERLGSSQSLELDVRLVCATNRNLLEMSQNGDFRDDLYYRLNVVTIELPPLRNRGEDLIILLNHFISSYSKENRFKPPQLSDDALTILKNYKWPGNVRELRNFCENLVVLHRGKLVSTYDLDPRFAQLPPSRGSKIDKDSALLSVEESEKRLLRNALLESKGNRTKAAQIMGISRRTLHRKLDRWPEVDTK